jgi:ABC-type branched-subunit amino acid transport system substrate-binding protein
MSYSRTQFLRRSWVLLAVVLVTGACGSRMDRQAIQAAERGGLSAEQAAAAPGSPAAGETSDGGYGAVTEGTPDAGVSSGDATASGSGSTEGASPAAGTSAGSAGGGSSKGASSAAGTGAAGTSVGGAAAAGKPGAKSAAAGPAAPTGPANKSPVVVGSVATLSGPLGAFTKDYIAAIQVWAKYINGRGGVNGHPIRHLVADDGGDPARYNAAVRQMVEEQGAITFLHNTIGFAGGDLSYATQKRIPLVGHEGGTETGYESPFVFTPAASGSTYAYAAMAAIAQVAVPAGKTKLAVLACSDVKLCDNFDKVLVGPASKELGFEVVYHARPSLTQPDFTGECISARQAGANVFIMVLDNNSVMRVGRSCARQNYKPLLGLFDNVTLPSVAQDPVMEGSAVATKAPPWTQKDIPGLAEIHQAFAAAAPGVEVSAAHVNGWVSAKTFEVAARNLPDRPTSEDVLNGLWAIKDDSLGGLTYPLNFPKGQNSPRKACWGVAVIKNKGFVAPNGSKLTCK